MARSVIIVGNFGATNIGDEAILESILIQLQRSSQEDLLYYVLSSNPEETTERYTHTYPIKSFPLFPLGIRSFLRRILSLLGSIGHLRKSSFALFGGGGLFTDESSLYAVVLWWVQFCYLRYILGQQVHIIGQSVGPLHTHIGKQLTAFVYKRAHSISVRDKQSVEVLKNMGITATYHPDMAWTLESGPRRRELDTKKLHIAISLRPWTASDIMDTLLATMRDIHSETPLLLHLIPMQYIREEDVSILQSFQSQCASHEIDTILHRPANYQDVFDILETCHMSIGMRLHFLILSCLVSTPSIPLSYSSKVQGVMKELEIPATNLSHITVQMLKDSIQDILEHGDERKEHLEKKIELLKEKSTTIQNILTNNT